MVVLKKDEDIPLHVKTFFISFIFVRKKVVCYMIQLDNYSSFVHTQPNIFLVKIRNSYLLSTHWKIYWKRFRRSIIFLRRISFKTKIELFKVFYICFNESLLKMMKNAFYLILKALFFLKIFKVLSWLFGHVEMGWLERNG